MDHGDTFQNSSGHDTDKLLQIKTELLDDARRNSERYRADETEDVDDKRISTFPPQTGYESRLKRIKVEPDSPCATVGSYLGKAERDNEYPNSKIGETEHPFPLALYQRQTTSKGKMVWKEIGNMHSGTVGTAPQRSHESTENSDIHQQCCNEINTYNCHMAAGKYRTITDVGTNTEEWPYVCEQCDYRCVYQSQFLRHTRTHTGDKPHACSLCDYRSVSKHQIGVHMRAHTGEKPYTCSVCDYRSAHRSHLASHMLRHTGLTHLCPHCKYTSVYKSNLTKHIKMHQKEKT